MNVCTQQERVSGSIFLMTACSREPGLARAPCQLYKVANPFGASKRVTCRAILSRSRVRLLLLPDPYANYRITPQASLGLLQTYSLGMAPTAFHFIEML